jgi:hypothetical protein
VSEEVLWYVSQLRRSDKNRSNNAYFSLIELDDPYVPEIIEAFYQEKDPKAQVLLVEVIWQHRLPESLPFLHEILRHESSAMWQCALDGIVAINDPQGIKILADEKARLELLNDKTARERMEWIVEAHEQLKEALEHNEGMNDYLITQILIES